jgi:hypothetical protein
MQEEPELVPHGPDQRAACHFPLEGSSLEGDASELFDEAVVEIQEESAAAEDSSGA